MLSQILRSPRHGQLVRLLVTLDAGVTPHVLPSDVNLLNKHGQLDVRYHLKPVMFGAWEDLKKQFKMF